MKVRNTGEYRKWVKSRLGYMEMTQAELARKTGIPRTRINESIHGKPSGRKYTRDIIKALGGREEDFEEFLKAV